MVRYVVDRSLIDDVDTKRGVATAGFNDDPVINSEIEILTSWDLAMEVAEAVAVGKARTEMTSVEKGTAAAELLANLNVTAIKGSNVILLSYKSADRELPMRVLQEFVKRYFEKHVQVHRWAGAFDFDQEKDLVYSQLTATEKELMTLKVKSGIMPFSASGAGLEAALAKSEQELNGAEAEFTVQKAVVNALQSGNEETTLASTGSHDGKARLAAEVVRLKALEARTEELRRLADRCRTAAADFTEVAPQVRELERRREQEEARYGLLESNLEKARMDEKLALDPSKIPNIIVVQKPSPAFVSKGKSF
jgi:uncharacterized protein involved in exopolysaccharide biosynthesis